MATIKTQRDRSVEMSAAEARKKYHEDKARKEKKNIAAKEESPFISNYVDN